MKSWSLKSSRFKDKYLILDLNQLGHVNFRKIDKAEVERTLASGQLPSNSEMLPFGYIRKIESNINSSKIELHYKKDSSLIYEFENSVLKKEFITCLIDLNPNLKPSIVKLTLLDSIKVQLIALILLIGYLSWCYASAYAIENGTHPGQDLVVVLLVASLGTNVIKYIILAAFILLGSKMYLTASSRTDKQLIDFHR